MDPSANIICNARSPSLTPTRPLTRSTPSTLCARTRQPTFTSRKLQNLPSAERLPPSLHPRSIDQATLRPRGPTFCKNGVRLLPFPSRPFCRAPAPSLPCHTPRAHTRVYARTPQRPPSLPSSPPRVPSIVDARPRPHSHRPPPRPWLAPCSSSAPRGMGLPFLCHRTPLFWTSRRRPHASSLPHKPPAGP